MHYSHVPDIFHLRDLDGKNGFTINAELNENIADAVTGAGDINGDGINDILVGDGNKNAYLIFGNSHTFSSQIYLKNLNGINGFTINGSQYNDNLGQSVSAAGDINGDGVDDIAIGAPAYSDVSYKIGQSYIIFGQKETFTNPFSLKLINGTNGFVFRGNDRYIGESSGLEISRLGDVNNDGLDDIIVGTQEYHELSYVIFGNAKGFNSYIRPENLNGKSGFIIRGMKDDLSFSISVNNAGDINADGIDDIAVSLPNSLNGAGKSYIIFGDKEQFPEIFDLDALDGNNGFTINGIQESHSGNAKYIGDVNCDGISDIAVGAPDALRGAGQTYIIYGNQTFPSHINLTDVDGMNGFVINGINTITSNNSRGDQSGSSVGNIGDFNGDGIDDFIIGAPQALEGAGQSYVIFGKSDIFNVELNLSDLDRNDGIIINGISSGDMSGWKVRGAGDVNDDGVDDILISALCMGFNKIYVVYGQKELVPSPTPQENNPEIDTNLILGLSILGLGIIASLTYFAVRYNKQKYSGYSGTVEERQSVLELVDMSGESDHSSYET
ncbi:MAG: FG-GAP-like repeat-containing protein [Rickettsiales bacterium]